jgi:DNA-binding response OmpR family regulator
MNSVLVIDDDENLRDTIAIILEQAEFRPIVAEDGIAGFEAAIRHKPDLILCDLKMPGMSGTDVCRQLRQSRVTTPLLILSAVDEELDKVLLLEIGADDYVTKPFGTRELLARIRALLRRSTPGQRRTLQFGDTVVDLERRAVTRGSEPVKMTPAEYNLLSFFVQNPDKPLTRDLLLNSVWGYDCFPNTRTVDAHVVKLRQKLEPDPGIPRHFLTLHGVGYRFLP